MTHPETGDGQPRPIPPQPRTPPGMAPLASPAAEHRPARRPPRVRPTSRVWFIVVLSVIAVLLVGLVVWLLTRGNLEELGASAADVPTPGAIVTTTAPPPTPLPLPREAAPADFRLGDCFSDFRPEAQKSMIVACDSPHSAQFVANYTYEDGEVYPGADALKAKALEACKAVTLSPDAAQFVLNFERVYPSSTSWEVGDRRVDCFVVAPEGNIINTSVLP